MLDTAVESYWTSLSLLINNSSLEHLLKLRVAKLQDGEVQRIVVICSSW